MQRSEHLIVLDQVAAEINRRLPDAAAFNEGNHGGVCCVYARVKCDEMDRARVFVIGTVNETWGALEAVETALPGWRAETNRFGIPKAEHALMAAEFEG